VVPPQFAAVMEEDSGLRCPLTGANRRDFSFPRSGGSFAGAYGRLRSFRQLSELRRILLLISVNALIKRIA